MHVDRQRHDRAAHVEVVGEGEDGDEHLSELECHVVEQLHRLVLQIAGTPLRVEDFTDILL